MASAFAARTLARGWATAVAGLARYTGVRHAEMILVSALVYMVFFSASYLVSQLRAIVNNLTQAALIAALVLVATRFVDVPHDAAPPPPPPIEAEPPPPASWFK